jgi:hypothetical protein
MAIKNGPAMWLYPIAAKTYFDVGPRRSEQPGATGYAEMIAHGGGDNKWRVSTNYKNIAVGDEILVYSVKINGNPPMVIGLGIVARGPWLDGNEQLIKIKWNVTVCRRLGKRAIDATWIAERLPRTKKTGTTIPQGLWPIIRQQLLAPATDMRRDISKIEFSAKFSKTKKQLLIDARLGQGKFKNNVAYIETGCRLTGVTDRSHLRASHIKPWSVSKNSERLDGNNGLLLAPHVDHLFDRGFITFTDAGKLLISPQLPGHILTAWSLPKQGTFGAFSKAQRKYLDYHRKDVFQAK